MLRAEEARQPEPEPESPVLQRIVALLERRSEEKPVEDVVAEALSAVTGKTPERIRRDMAAARS